MTQGTLVLLFFIITIALPCQDKNQGKLNVTGASYLSVHECFITALNYKSKLIKTALETITSLF